MTKYGARRCEYNGYKFDSQKEMRRYQELELLQKAGQIANLHLQVPYALCSTEHGKLGRLVTVTVYRADFVYDDLQTGRRVVEDVKSEATRKNAVYRLKKKWMRLQYGVEIFET